MDVDTILPGSPIYTRFQEHNPSRPPDWRCQHGQALAAGRRRLSPKLDDPDAVAVARFLRSRAGCRTDRDLNRLEQKSVGLTDACWLAEDQTDLGWEVRSRILAGEEDSAVAARCGLIPETINWYERLHFNVRGHLDACDWIATKVIGIPSWGGPSESRTGRVWMLFGYNAGPLALDVVMAVSRNRPLPRRVFDGAPGDPHRDEARLRLLVRMAILATAMNTSAEVEALQELHRELLDLDGRSPSEGDPLRLQAMLSTLPIALRPVDPPGELPAERLSPSPPPITPPVTSPKKPTPASA